MRARHRHAGAPCSISMLKVCRAIELVLRAVRSRFPRDYARLAARVAGFRPLTKAERADGTAGWWKPLPLRMVRHPLFGMVREDDDQGRGVIALTPLASLGHIAHELGHAAATEDDHARRHAPDDEWTSELTADYYGYRWGFGRDVARDRPARRFAHHCAGPGQVIGLGDLWWRVSRRFVMHPTEPPAWAAGGKGTEGAQSRRPALPGMPLTC